MRGKKPLYDPAPPGEIDLVGLRFAREKITFTASSKHSYQPMLVSTSMKFNSLSGILGRVPPRLFLIKERALIERMEALLSLKSLEKLKE